MQAPVNQISASTIQACSSCRSLLCLKTFSIDRLFIEIIQNSHLIRSVPLVFQERVLRAVSGQGTTDRQGFRVQEVPQKRWQESAEGRQERDHDPEDVCDGYRCVRVCVYCMSVCVCL